MTMISDSALLGVIYAWYISLRLRGLDKDDAVKAMAESWHLSSLAADKHGNTVHTRAKDLVKLLDNGLREYRDQKNNPEIDGLESFGKIIKDNSDLDWKNNGGAKL